MFDRTNDLRKLSTVNNFIGFQCLEEMYRPVLGAADQNDISNMTYSWVALFQGTTKIKNLDDNIGSVEVNLTKVDIKEILDAVPIEEVAGDRIYDSMQKATWKVSNTTPKICNA